MYVNRIRCRLKCDFFFFNLQSLCKWDDPGSHFKPFHQLHNWQPLVKDVDGYKFQRKRSAKLQALHWANYIIAAQAAKLEIFTTASRHRRFILNPDLIWFTYCLSETMCTVCVGGDGRSIGLSWSFCLVADNKSSHLLQWSKCSFSLTSQNRQVFTMHPGFCIFVFIVNNVGSNLLLMSSVHVYRENLIQLLIIHFDVQSICLKSVNGLKWMLQKWLFNPVLWLLNWILVVVLAFERQMRSWHSWYDFLLNQKRK